MAAAAGEEGFGLGWGRVETEWEAGPHWVAGVLVVVGEQGRKGRAGLRGWRMPSRGAGRAPTPEVRVSGRFASGWGRAQGGVGRGLKAHSHGG